MRVAVVGGLAQSLINFRGELLRAMVAEGHEVLALAPEDDPSVREALRALGVSYARVPFDRAGLSPLRDAVALFSLARTLARFRADAVLTYTAKPVVYGSLAARFAGVPRRVAMITGVGSALGGGPGARRALAFALKKLYAVALRQTDLVFFQNPDDEALFRRLGLVGPRQRVRRINGSGVDLARFSPVPMPAGPTSFLMIARLLRDKGVFEYVEAARAIRKSQRTTRFWLLGGLDGNPSGVTAAELDAWRKEGVIEYLGATADVRPFIAQAHVVVLPSYREGMPRSLLEAMAMARPIITTGAPGCKETVEHGRNGLLVRVRDAEALEEGMRQLLAVPERLGAMGRYSRVMAEQRFDVHAVNRVILAEMGLAGAEGAT
jgi:glycosyltransferase involved in cell wall biosynthesis